MYIPVETNSKRSLADFGANFLRSGWFAALVVLLAVGFWTAKGRTNGHVESKPATWPGTHWEKQLPAEAGMDVRLLDELAASLQGSGCITRNGRLIYSWGHPEGATDVASIVKPLLMMILLRAVEEGKLASLDSPVALSEPALSDLNPSLNHKDRLMTWRHLVTQTACYGVEENPGTAFDYNDCQSALFYDTLISKVFGASKEQATEKVLVPYLTAPLRCEDNPRFAFGEPKLADGRLLMSPRDLCRVGWLAKCGGRWIGDVPLIDGILFRRTLSDPLSNTLPRTKGVKAEMLPGQRTLGGDINQEDHRGAYSWMWWINGWDSNQRRLWPDAPDDAFGAFGMGGQRALVILPSQGIVASWLKTSLQRMPMSGEGKAKVNRALQLQAAAVINQPAKEPSS